MRYLIAILLCTLLSNPVFALAQATPADAARPPVPQAAPAAEMPQKDCQSSDLAIVGNKEGKEASDFVFRMGDDLTIKATGGCASKIRTLVKSGGPKALALYLDGVRMDKLPMSSSEGATAEDLRLNFRLARNPNDDDNRKAWDTLLRNQGSYLMTLPAALVIGSEPAFSVQSAQPFQFYVAKREAILATLVVCLIVFFGAYSLLVRSPTVLRDEKNGPYSLGKSQMAFWGLLVMLSFAGVWFLSYTMERIPPQVLILLGISGATGLGAVVIGENKKAGKEAEISQLQKEQQALEKEQLANPATFPPSSQARLLEIKSAIASLSQPSAAAKPPAFWHDICDDGNGMSFHRLQVVFWTVLLGVVFVWSVAQAMSMPEFPETLLTLMGISSGTYLGFKIPEKS